MILTVLYLLANRKVMKNLIFILILCLTACKQKREQSSINTEFDYLIGDWERTNEKEGNITFEHWKAINSNQLKGHGYTLKAKDTVFNERMTLHKKNEVWTLSVVGPNEEPTLFKVTSKEENSFIAQNPENEFPKEIKYFYFDDVLTAKVSAGEMEVSFIYWRMEE